MDCISDTLHHRGWNYLWIVLCGTVLFLIVCIVVLSLVPPVSRDALTHHLALPKLYLQYGEMRETPHMVFSYYPMNLDLLYLIPLYFGNDIVPKLIHFAFALLTAGSIFFYLRSRLGKNYAIFSALFFLSIPIVIKLSTTAYVDLGLVFFSTASLLMLLKWAETGFRFRFLMLSAAACGLAMGTKYNGLITFFLLTLFVPFLYTRGTEARGHKSAKAVAYTLSFAGVALLLFSPWMVKNYLWTGNPIFPLYDQWFSSQESGGKGFVSIFTVRSALYGETWWEMMLLPLRIFFEGRDGDPQYFDGELNPFLLFLPLLAFAPGGKHTSRVKREKNVFLAFACLFFAFAFFSSGLRIRYISPIIPPLIILSGYGMKRGWEICSFLASALVRKLVYGMALGLLALCLGINGRYVVKQFEAVRPLDYLSGELSRDEYIQTYRPEYAAIQYINSRTPEKAKILFMFMGNRGYYCDRGYVFDSIRGRSRFGSIVNQSENSKQIWEGLRELDISHVLMQIDLFERWVNSTFDPEKKSLIKRFFSVQCRYEYQEAGFAVFGLVKKG